MEKIKDIMGKRFIAFNENSSVKSIAKKMGELDLGCAIIVKGDKPIGIITERDIVKRVVAKDLDVNKIKAKDIMTSPVKTIDPDANIYYVAKIMDEKGYKRYPVAKNGKFIGLVTQTDLINYFTEQRRKFVLKNLSKKLRKKYL
ncbi:MAG: CBS domain-containing protein [Nanoarchaeota archaeon]